MTAGTLARYTTVQGLKVPVTVTHRGADRYGAVIVLRVTSTPKGQRAYRKGDVLTVSADSTGLTVR